MCLNRLPKSIMGHLRQVQIIKDGKSGKLVGVLRTTNTIDSVPAMY